MLPRLPRPPRVARTVTGTEAIGALSHIVATAPVGVGVAAAAGVAAGITAGDVAAAGGAATMYGRRSKPLTSVYKLTHFA